MIFKRLAVVLLAAAFVNAVFAKDNLAVLPFTGGTNEEGETIAELFSFSDELNAVFTPIPRTSIARAIRSEQNFQTSAGMTDPETIAAIGRELGAKYVVAGNITKLGSRKLLIISILKIDDLRQIAGDIQTYGRITEIQDKLPDMTRNIIEAMKADSLMLDKLAVTPVELGGDIDTRVADTLAQILSINLIRSGKYAVYPRTATLEQVQTEYGSQTSGITADENVVDMGKGENPRLVLSVAARRLGNQNMFNAAIINMESGAQLIGRSVNYKLLNDGVTAMENLSRELTGVSTPGGEKTAKAGGAAFGYGVLNLALGLGSFIQGDVGGGVITLLSYGAAAGFIAWELALAHGDELENIPGNIGIGVAGFAVLYGFIRPFVYQKNRALARFVDRIQMAVVPEEQGGFAARVSYTVWF